VCVFYFCIIFVCVIWLQYVNCMLGNSSFWGSVCVCVCVCLCVLFLFFCECVWFDCGMWTVCWVIQAFGVVCACVCLCVLFLFFCECVWFDCGMWTVCWVIQAFWVLILCVCVFVCFIFVFLWVCVIWLRYVNCMLGNSSFWGIDCVCVCVYVLFLFLFFLCVCDLVASFRMVFYSFIHLLIISWCHGIWLLPSSPLRRWTTFLYPFLWSNHLGSS